MENKKQEEKEMKKIRINRRELEKTLRELDRMVDEGQNVYHLRVDENGGCYIDEDTSYTTSSTGWETILYRRGEGGFYYKSGEADPDYYDTEQEIEELKMRGKLKEDDEGLYISR